MNLMSLSVNLSVRAIFMCIAVLSFINHAGACDADAIGQPVSTLNAASLQESEALEGKRLTCKSAEGDSYLGQVRIVRPRCLGAAPEAFLDLYAPTSNEYTGESGNISVGSVQQNVAVKKSNGKTSYQFKLDLVEGLPIKSVVCRTQKGLAPSLQVSVSITTTPLLPIQKSNNTVEIFNNGSVRLVFTKNVNGNVTRTVLDTQKSVDMSVLYAVQYAINEPESVVAPPDVYCLAMPDKSTVYEASGGMFLGKADRPCGLMGYRNQASKKAIDLINAELLKIGISI